MIASLIHPIVLAPAEEPVSLAEIRMHLRNPETTSNDAELLWFIQTAREQVEHKTGMALLTQTWDAKISSFCGDIELPLFPVQSAVITYTDTAGVEQVVPEADYVIKNVNNISSIQLAYSKSWPSSRSDATVIRFIAGYETPERLPESIKSRIKLFVTTLYEHRKPQVVGVSVQEIEFMDHLLDPYRIMSV